MTYSRPGIGKTNIVTGNSSGNTPSKSLPSGSSLSESAPQRLDMSRPQRASDNELNRYKDIKSFLSFFSESVVPFANKELNRQATNELGRFVDEYPDALDATNQSAELVEARAKLSPRAQNAGIEAQALYGSQIYQARLAAEVSKPERAAALSTPGDDDETVAARAKAFNDAKAAAGAVFPNPYQRLKYAGKAGAAESAVQSEFYKKRVDAVAQRNIQTQAQGFSGWISNVSDIAEKASLQSEGGQSFEYSSLVTATQDGVAELNQTMMGASAVEAQRRGIELSIDDETDTKKQIQLVDTMIDVYRRNEILSRENLNMGYIPMASFKGMTLIDYLEARKQELEKDDDRSTYNELLMKMSQLQQQGRDKEAEDLAQGAHFHDAELYNRLQGAEFQGRMRPTVQDQTNEASYRARVRNGETWKSLMPEIENDNFVSEAFVVKSGEAAIVESKDPDYGRSPESQAARRQLISEMGRDILINGFNGPQGYMASLNSEDRKQIKDEEALQKRLKQTGIEMGTPFADSVKQRYELEVQQLLAEKIGEKMAAGEDWSPRDLQTEVQKEYLAKKWKEANPPGAAPPNKQQQYEQFEGTAAKSIVSATQANGGNFTVPESAVYGPVLEQWKKDNPKKNFNDLRKGDKDNLIIKSYENMEIFDTATKETRRITRKEAEQKYDELIKTVEKQVNESGSTPGFTRTGLPNQVDPDRSSSLGFPDPKDPSGRYQNLQKAEDLGKIGVFAMGAEIPFAGAGSLLESGVKLFGAKILLPTIDFLNKSVENSVEGVGDQSNAGESVTEFYNTGGFGGKAMEVAGGMLNILVGASPATAAPLENATPESLQALRDTWPKRNVSIETPPLPQVAAATPSRYVPNAITNDKHEIFVLIGVAEGTRTAGGGYTRNYYGHSDGGDGNNNRGTVSGGRNNSLNPQQVDRKWMAILTQRMGQVAPALRAVGLQPGTVGYNRMMFNVLDLTVQSPLAVQGLLGQLGNLRQQSFTVEAIAKARADAFFNPQTGRLEASGFNNNYKVLFKDQRSRAGVFDYRSRL